MSPQFTRNDNELLHRMCETYDVDPVPGRRFAGRLSRYIHLLEKNLAAFAEFYNSGYMFCTCAKCYGAAHISSYKCPKETLIKKLNGRKSNDTGRKRQEDRVAAKVTRKGARRK